MSQSVDSESDMTEDVNTSVNIAFEVMKQRLSKCTAKQEEPKQKVQNGRLLKKIYETFTNNTHSAKTKKKKKKPKKDSQNKEETVQNTNTEFFIDRSSGPGAIKNKVNQEETVETFDLSNLTVANGDNNKTESKTNRDRKRKQKKKKQKKKEKESGQGLSSELQTNISTDDVYINVDPDKNPKGHQPSKQSELRHKEPEIMKKSVITDDFEKQESIPTANTSHRQKKRERKLEREKTKGDKWYHMPAVELTEEQKTDLKVLQMRKALNPKRFYKGNDVTTAPKFVQFGKVIESAADFYDSRIPKKQRKATIVEELLADSEFRRYNKRKYEEIQESRRLGKGPYQHMKRLKKRKK